MRARRRQQRRHGTGQVRSPSVRIRPSEHHRGSAVFTRRPRELPQRPDLHVLVLQERLLPIFHFALNPGGFIVLGVSETVGLNSGLFEVIDRDHKIYRRIETSQRPHLRFMTGEWLLGTPARRTGGIGQAVDVQREAERLILERYAPPSVLVNEHFDIQHYRGRTGPFLECPPDSRRPTSSAWRRTACSWSSRAPSPRPRRRRLRSCARTSTSSMPVRTWRSPCEF